MTEAKMLETQQVEIVSKVEDGRALLPRDGSALARRTRGVSLTHVAAIRRERGNNYSRAKEAWTRNGHKMNPAEFRALNDCLNDLREDLESEQVARDLAAIRAQLAALQGGDPAPVVTELSHVIDALDAELTESSDGEDQARDLESLDGTEQG